MIRGNIRHIAFMCSKTLWAMGTMVILALGACQKTEQKPHSTGKPYEVLIVAADSCGERATAALLDTPVEGLPQEEPLFDGHFCRTKDFDKTMQRAHSIVIIDITENATDSVSITEEHDVYAHPQLIVRIKAPTLAEYEEQTLYGEAGREICRLLEGQERRTALAQLRKHHLEQSEAIIERSLGARMLIPDGLTAMKRGEDFIWLSNNRADEMQNIVIFKGENTDSALQRNIPGETDDMYMRTVLTIPDKTHGGLTRGLWDIQGDAMGGPFVARTVGGVTAMAFVYAPGKKKRNMIRQLETALHTLNKQ